MAEDLLPRLNLKTGLDPKFEWNDSITDEEHIFDEEKEVSYFCRLFCF
jgi:hypothetical protein